MSVWASIFEYVFICIQTHLKTYKPWRSILNKYLIISYMNQIMMTILDEQPPQGCYLIGDRENDTSF